VRRAGALLIAGLFVAGLAITAWAALVTVHDPNDTQGLFDVRTVRFDPERPPEWTVITFGAWTTNEVWDKGYVLVYLDTMGSAEPDYFALIRSNGEDMKADLYRDLANDRLLRPLVVWRNGGRQVSVRIPLRFVNIGPHRKLYRWSVLTLFTSPNCKVPCIDPVPDDGMIDQTLTPSLTPTPTPSPTLGG
jgi:hypothetical protein